VSQEIEEAELALLGAWLQDGQRVGDVLGRLRWRAAWWKTRALREIAQAAELVRASGRPVDALTVLDQVRRGEAQPDTKDKAASILERAMEACPAPSHAEYYAQILRREYMAEAIRKRLSDLVGRLENEDPAMVAAEGGEALRRALDDNEVLGDISVEKVMREQVDAWRQAAADQIAGKPRDVGVPLPWWRLTKMTGGLPNDLVVLAARPSVGKTALEGVIRMHAARKGYHVLSMLMDMGAERVLPRDACRTAGVSMPKLKFGFARRDQLDAVDAAGAEMAKLPLHFVTRTTRLEALQMRARHLKAKGMLDLITVDHCQLVSYAGSERHDMRAIVTTVTARLKALAQELRVPVLLLSQLRRADPGAREEPPRLDDLRDSGSLEQDAAVVMMLHRDMKQVGKWKKAGDEEAIADKKRPVGLYVRKNQDGGLGMQPFIMRPHYFTFELADEEYRPIPDDSPAKDAELCDAGQ